jgi:sialic acid synthase SpsE
VIAEAGVNHSGDIDLAKKLVTIAPDAGANTVKSRTFTADRLASADAPKARYQVGNTGRPESHRNTDLSLLKRIAKKGKPMNSRYLGDLPLFAWSYSICSIDIDDAIDWTLAESVVASGVAWRR